MEHGTAKDDDRLSKLMRLFDGSSQPIRIREIGREILALGRELPDDIDDDLRFRIQAEWYAFHLVERDVEGGRGPGVSWVGQFRSQDEDGNEHEQPDPAEVGPEIVRYWRQRIREVKHPALKRRYAGLVWGLWKQAGADHPGVDVARAFVDATLEITPANSAQPISEMVLNQIRALNVALGIKDDKRFQATKRAIIEFERRHAEDELLGTWGQSYDHLVAGPKRRHATDAEEEEIVELLEARLDRLTGARSQKGLWAAFEAGKKAGEHHNRHGRDDRCREIAGRLRDHLVAATDEGNPSLAARWSLAMSQLAAEWGLLELESAMRERHERFSRLERHTLRSHVTKVGFGEDELEEAATRVAGETDSETLDSIAVEYLADRNALTTRLGELAHLAPVSHHMPRKQLARDGRPVAMIGGVDADEPGQLVALATQTLWVSLPFMARTIGFAEGRHGLELSALVSHFAGRPLFEFSEPDGLLERCLGAWIDADHMVFAHLAVPLIERAIRTLVEHAGGGRWKPSRHGGMKVRLLDELLRCDEVTRALGPDICFHLRAILTDARGFNLRNEIAHGIHSFRGNGQARALVLFHALLLVALVREQQPPSVDEDDQKEPPPAPPVETE